MRIRGDPLCDLMHIALSGQAGSNIDELPDAGRADQKLDSAADEVPILVCCHDSIRYQSKQLSGECLIGGQVGSAAQQNVIDPGHVRR